MESSPSQPVTPGSKNTILYVAIAIAACAAAAALGFLARSLLGSSDTIANLLPSINTVAFVRATDVTDLSRWTSGPLIRDTMSGSGSTASGSVLRERINAFHTKVSRQAKAFTTSTPTGLSSLTIALLRTGTTDVSEVMLAEFTDESGAITAMNKLVETARSGETTLNKGEIVDIRTAHLGKESVPGFATRMTNVVAFSPDQASLRSVLETSQDHELSLSASREYSTGRLSDARGYQVYADYPKAISILKPVLQSDRTWRDILTLLSPLESNVTAMHLSLEKHPIGYRMRTRVMTTSKLSDALIGQQEADRQAAPLANGEEVILAISGYDLLNGYRRFGDYLALSDPDSRTVLEAISRFFLATYVTPHITPVILSDTSRGGYSLVMKKSGSGSTVSYGWVGMDDAKVTPEKVGAWFENFTSGSRLMFTERTRPMRIGDGETASERYLAPLPSETETTVLANNTVLYSTKTGTALSPSAFWRDGRLFFSSDRSQAERLADGDLGRRESGAPRGSWLLRMRISALFGMTFGPLDALELSFALGKGGLRIDGLLSTMR